MKDGSLQVGPPTGFWRDLSVFCGVVCVSFLSPPSTARRRVATFRPSPAYNGLLLLHSTKKARKRARLGALWLPFYLSCRLSSTAAEHGGTPTTAGRTRPWQASVEP